MRNWKRNLLGFLTASWMAAATMAAVPVPSSCTLVGCITDEATGQPVPDADLFLEEGGQHTASRDGGYFLFRKVAPGVYRLHIRVLGYRPRLVADVRVMSDTTVNVALAPDPIRMETVLVTGTRSDHLRSQVPVSSAVLTEETIRLQNGITAGEVLESSAGLFVKDQGGLAGIKTLSVRGSADSQVLVLLDGQRLNSAQDGGVDLNAFLVEALERIEIIKGGHSALMGTDAIGGAVHLFSKSAIPPGGFAYGMRSTLGSFGTNSWSAFGSLRVGLMDFHAAFNRTRSEGNFEYVLPGSDSRKRRENNDFLGFNALFKARMNLEYAGKIQVIVHHAESERGSADPVTSTFPSSDARRDEVRNQVGLLFERQVLNTVRMDAQVYYQARVNRFHSLYEKDRHENNAAGMEVLARWIVHPAVLMTAGAELRRDGLESTKFNHLQRHTQSFNAQVEIDHALNAFGWRTQWKWIPALRQDRTRAGKANLCPKIGVLFRPFPFSDFSLKANAGKSFRLPTFNDLYWPELVIPGWGGVRGNSALKPETGFNADAGIVYRTKAPGMFAVECTAFQNSLHDLILWESDEQLVYAPRNVGSARITGLETEFTYRTPGEHWDFAVAPTWMRARDLTVPGKAVRLVYRPDFKLDASAGFRFGAFRFRVQARAVDTRYTRADNSKRLPSYWTMGGNVQFEHRIFGGQFRSKLEMNNAFDRSIYIIEGYPTPGREFRFTLGLDR